MQTPLTLCNVQRSQLLIVDLQTRLMAAMPETEQVRMLKHTRTLLQAACSLGVPVTVTEQYPRGLGPTHADITAILPDSAALFQKTGFSCCAADGLTARLASQSRRQIVLAGQEIHVCILQTAAGLQAAGYEVYIVEDAVCSRKEEDKNNALARLRQSNVTVACHESVVFEWLRDAQHPQFKTLSQLLR